jgi:hypothetical protein
VTQIAPAQIIVTLGTGVDQSNDVPKAAGHCPLGRRYTHRNSRRSS